MSITMTTAQDSLMQKSRELSKWKQGERYQFHYEMILPATRERVFPLLCPILEYDWLNNWKCTMIYSESGVSEDNCIFYKRTGFPFYRRMTFQVIQYDPDKCIGFLIYIDHVGSVRFELNLRPVGKDRTTMSCDYLMTGHSSFGNRQLKRYREKIIEGEVRSLEQDLVYWLENKSKRPLK